MRSHVPNYFILVQRLEERKEKPHYFHTLIFHTKVHNANILPEEKCLVQKTST